VEAYIRKPADAVADVGAEQTMFFAEPYHILEKIKNIMTDIARTNQALNMV